MDPTVLRHRDRAPGPWANGGGITYEVARWPEGGAHFDWRLSVAEVATEGPFSSFPGIDRALILLSGRMLLIIDGVEYDVPVFEPLHFAGEAHVMSVLPAGPTLDLNVMTRRERARAHIEIVSDPVVTATPHGDADVVALIVLAGSWSMSSDDEVLTAADAVVSGSPMSTSGSPLSLTRESATGVLARVTLTAIT